MTSAAKTVRMAYLISRYPAVSHTFILRELRQLREAGFDIRSASVNPPDRELADMTPDEVEETGSTYYLKRHGLQGALLGHLWGWCHPRAYWRGLKAGLGFGGWDLKRSLFGLFYFTEALMLARWLEQQRLQHLHVHFATAAANIVLILKQMVPMTLSLTIHGPDEFYDVAGEKLLDKIEAADFLVCISRFARSQLMKLSPASAWSKFEVCPLGVDVAHYNPQPTVASDRPFTVLCVGRLTPAKGQHLLLEACASLRDWGHVLRLVMVGTGPDEASLRASAEALGIQELVTFTGAQNQDQVRAWYRDSDVFALPSFAEGVPVVLMEAMASGVPCLTTRITGIPELIRDGIDGLLVTPSDVQELADSLALLKDDAKLRRELGEAGRHRVAQAYNLPHNVARLGEIFLARLGGKTC
jgi:glycosyltransferase involved in cell wall biosynthesis